MEPLSFSKSVKNEILSDFGEDRHCRIAMLSAIINNCCDVVFSDGQYLLGIKTENHDIIGKFYELIKKDFQIDSIHSKLPVKKILQATGILDLQTGQLNNKINAVVVKSTCCKRAYVRGAFLCCGSINDPQKTYHLEFVTGQENEDAGLIGLLKFFELSPKTVMRKAHRIVYFKDGEQISVVLNIIGAHVSLMEFENRRVYKNMGNSINRIANCEAANADKSVSAAVRQIEDIQLINRTIGLGSLPPQLEEAALIRMEHPEYSLKEIAQKINPPVSKSGVNHRLRKISQIAENIK